MGEVVCVVNQKGGVGKTTVTLGLASAAMAAGHRVLVVDLDPQAAATWVLGLDPTDLRSSVADVLSGGRGGAAKVVTPSTWSHLVDVVPASPELQQLEVLRGGVEQLLGGTKPQLRLRRALAGVSKGYGVVLVDCPPSLGDLTTNGLAAADTSLVVAEPTALGLRGIGPVADLIESTWSRYNGELDLAGVILNRVPARSTDADGHREALARTVGGSSLWEPAIPHRVVVAEAAAHRQPIHGTGSRGRSVAEVFDQLYSRLWGLIGV
jgi:cellulose biosynthesis protein BcsQ